MRNVITLCTLSLCIGLAAIAITAAPGSAAVTTDNDMTVEQLQERFQRLHRSLVIRGGITAEDHEAIRDLRDRFARFNAQNPGNESGLAGELQLSMWLEDQDRADVLFRELVLAAPEKPNYGLAWIAHLERTGRADRVDEVYDWLIENTTGGVELLIGRAAQHKVRSHYAEAIALLADANLDPAEHIEGVRILAECYFAENRFDDALALLESIPEEALEQNRSQRLQIEQLKTQTRDKAELWAAELEIRSTEAAADDLPRVELITERGRIVLELFENNAPNTVANFLTLVEDEFYDGTRFHRIEREFVTQGGDPNTKDGEVGQPGTGGPGYRIADEWQREDARKHFAGTLAMANSGPDTAGSQFYITHRPTPHLNTGYTVFGRVLEGLDVARQIQPMDLLESARVLRKRDHEYEVEKLRTIREIEDDLHVPDFLREQ